MREDITAGAIIFLAVFGLAFLVNTVIVLVDMAGTALWGCSCG